MYCWSPALRIIRVGISKTLFFKFLLLLFIAKFTVNLFINSSKCVSILKVIFINRQVSKYVQTTKHIWIQVHCISKKYALQNSGKKNLGRQQKNLGQSQARKNICICLT